MGKINEKLEDLTSNILLQNDMYKLPANVIQIANACGIKVYAGELMDGISGAITYDKESELFEITVNKNDSLERQRFTIAHELGHYFLHKDMLEKDEFHIDAMYRGNITNDEKARDKEKEVDYFAGALLMNRVMLENLYNEYSIAELADIFKVSISAMTVRLDILGLL